MLQKVQKLNNNFAEKSIIETLTFLSKEFKNKIAFSTSFGEEDQVITDIIFSNNLPIKIFTLDTGRLFEETYKTFNKTLKLYKKNIYTYFPDTEDIEKLYHEKGSLSFYQSIENRKECCFLRKVKPLQRALKDVECWITGLRSQQSRTRQNLEHFQWDNVFKTIKYHPLLDWTLEDIKQEIKNKNIPYNALHDKGFISIGCEPCTRAIAENEDIRAGRWWWENNTQKECGLHKS